MAHHRIWRFRPSPGYEQEFAEAYEGNGRWSALFARADGYLGTSLLRPAKAGGWWLTIDRWRSAANFEAFKRDFGGDYRTLDNELEGLAADEEFVGAFDDN